MFLPPVMKILMQWPLDFLVKARLRKDEDIGSEKVTF
jgi:hypothetical protein